MPAKRPLDGQRFGRLVVREASFRRDKHSYLRVRCDCGKIFDVRRDDITRVHNAQKSCGCLNAELIAQGKQGINSPRNHEKRRKNGIASMARYQATEKGQTHLKRLSEIGTKTLRQYHKEHPEAALAGQLACPKKDTKLELAVQARLDSLGIRYEHPFNLHGHFLSDFYLPDSNTIVEADGCYWHGCEPCGYNNGKDKRTKARNAYIRAHGYNLLVVPEHESPDFLSLNISLASYLSSKAPKNL